jgi:hypothetical protein
MSNICPMCNEQKPAADADGHCSYACASGGGGKKDPYPSYTINGVQVTIQEDAKILLRGRTFDHREKIKSLGGTWEPTTKTWALPPMTDVTWLKPPPPPPAPQPRPRELWTRAEWQNYCLRKRGSCGPCCRQAHSYESRPYGPICYSCPIHGETVNNYTGD